MLTKNSNVNLESAIPNASSYDVGSYSSSVLEITIQTQIGLRYDIREIDVNFSQKFFKT